MRSVIGITPVIDAILTTFWYDEPTAYAIMELISRIKKIDGERTATGQQVFSILVLLVGDYGIAPRAGWINDDREQQVLDAIAEWVREFDEALKNDDYDSYRKLKAMIDKEIKNNG